MLPEFMWYNSDKSKAKKWEGAVEGADTELLTRYIHAIQSTLMSLGF
jgi:hypothetical protein